jgi:MATE family multidrug resistance protein
MIVLQKGIWHISQGIYAPEKEVLNAFKTYYYILIWGAPLVLISYVNIGWLMGRKHAKETLLLQVGTNAINIILDLVLVVYLKMGVQGVAIATLVAQGVGFLVGLLLISLKLDIFKALEYKSNFLSIDAFKKIAMVNTDLFIRTVCLLVMTHFFVAKGSTYGKTVLAANAVLFQIQYIIAYLYDGLANASSVFVGKALGEKNSDAFEGVLHISKKCTYALSTGILCIFLVFRREIIQVFTSLAQVREIAGVYSGWLILFPFSIGIGLVYYGIFTGCTFTRPVRDSMVISLVAFLVVYLGFVPKYGNHGLWAAFIVFSAGRSLVLAMNIKKLKCSVFEDSATTYCYNHTQ